MVGCHLEFCWVCHWVVKTVVWLAAQLVDARGAQRDGNLVAK